MKLPTTTAILQGLEQICSSFQRDKLESSSWLDFDFEGYEFRIEPGKAILLRGSKGCQVFIYQLCEEIAFGYARMGLFSTPQKAMEALQSIYPNNPLKSRNYGNCWHCFFENGRGKSKGIYYIFKKEIDNMDVKRVERQALDGF